VIYPILTARRDELEKKIYEKEVWAPTAGATHDEGGTPAKTGGIRDWSPAFRRSAGPVKMITAVVS
jgi:hypothetical protein